MDNLDNKSVFLSLLKVWTTVSRLLVNSLMTLIYVASSMTGFTFLFFFLLLRIFFSISLYSKLLDDHPLKDHFPSCDDEQLLSYNMESNYLYVYCILNILCDTLFFFSVFSLCLFVPLSGKFCQHHIIRFHQIVIALWLLNDN